MERRHIADLGDEIRIGGEFERLQPGAAEAPNARQIRCTVETESPHASAMLRELQWVALSGALSSVLTITASMRASSTLRGVKSVQAALGEAPVPLAHRVRRRSPDLGKPTILDVAGFFDRHAPFTNGAYVAHYSGAATAPDSARPHNLLLAARVLVWNGNRHPLFDPIVQRENGRDVL